MANAQVGPLHADFFNKNKLPDDDDMGYTSTNYASIEAMRARLTAINAGYYTSARLDAMTTNDMIYAIRVNDDSGTF